MGTVYKAYDRLTKETIALKHVSVSQQNSRNITSSLDTRHQLTLTHEFQTLASLRHPHIISVLNYGFDDEQQPYFTMTLLDDAVNIIEASQNLSLQEQIHLINQMFLALAYLHQRGIVHRDMKPDNVLVQARHVKVLDFGLSLEKTEEENRSGGGTLAYMAPETLRSGLVNQTSDLYSVGVMLYQIFTGNLPYAPQNIAARLRKPISSEALAGHPLEVIIMRLLLIDPESRYQSAMQVIEAICKVAEMPLPEETKDIREGYLQRAPFVGRTTELGKLETVLTNTSQGHEGVLWLVGGESGVGKSRLIDELRVRAVVNGVQAIQGQAVTDGGIPFEMWRPIIRHLVLSSELSALQASILKELVPDISDLLGYNVPDAPSLTGKGYMLRLADAIENMIAQQKSATLLILEDLQWANESLMILSHLASVLNRLPKLMIIGTFRNDESPQLPDEIPHNNQMTLARLDDDAIKELSRAILGETENQAQIVSLLQRETEGNTFFLVEVVRSLAEVAGKISDIGDVALPQHIFTSRMKEILQRRLQKLPEKYQPLLVLAAVAGRQINPAILRTAFPDFDVDAWLYTCDTLSIIMIQNNQWLFSHDKLREAVLVELSDSDKKTYHRQVAEAIEVVHPNKLEQAEVLLEHWHIAGAIDKEYMYLEMVAPRLIYNTGEYVRIQKLIKRMTNALADNDPRHVLLLNYLAESYWLSGQVDEAWSAADDALARTVRHHDLKGEATALSNLGDVARIKADYEQAFAYYNRSLKLHEELENELGIAICLHQIGDTFGRLAQYKSAKEYYERALERHRKIDNLRGIAIALEELAFIHRINSNPEQALSTIEEALAIAKQLGDQRNIGLMLNSLGRVYRDLDDMQSAEDYLQQSLQILESIGDEYGMAWTQYNLGLLGFLHEKYDYAEQMTYAAYATSEKMNDKYGISMFGTALGYIYLMQEKTKTITFLYSGLEYAKMINIPPLGLTAMIGFAYLDYEQGKLQRVYDILHLAFKHPAANTQVAFRLNHLSEELSAILTQVKQDNSDIVDYDQMVDLLLAEFAPDDSAI